MYFQFDYHTPIEDLVDPQSETIECRDYNQATEVAHQLGAMWWEHKRNLHTELINENTVVIRIEKCKDILGIVSFLEVPKPTIKTADDIAEQFRKICC